MKKHNTPDHMELTDEFIQKLHDNIANKDYDCFTADEKLKKGLSLEKVQLEHCSSWTIRNEANPQDKIIYYIHGGGFVNGCTKDLFKFISYAVKHFGYNLYSVDYRLTPRFKCLDAVGDCEDGYRWLLERYDPKKIILMQRFL